MPQARVRHRAGRFKVIQLPSAEIIGKYRTGSTIEQLSHEYGVSLAPIRRVLAPFRLSQKNAYMVKLTLIPLYDLAWAAGFFDGEGNANIAKRGFTPSLGISNTHEGVIRRLVALFGGKFYSKPQDKYLKNRRPQWRWMVYAYQAVAVCAFLEQFLFVKARHARIIMDHATAKKSGDVRLMASLREELRTLNLRGIQV